MRATLSSICQRRLYFLENWDDFQWLLYRLSYERKQLGPEPTIV